MDNYIGYAQSYIKMIVFWPWEKSTSDPEGWRMPTSAPESKAFPHHNQTHLLNNLQYYRNRILQDLALQYV